LSAETRTTIEASAPRNANGQFIDQAGNVIRNPQYGHLPGFENRRLIAAAEQLGLSQEQLTQYVNARPQFFYVQEGAPNMAHVGEIPGTGNLGRILNDMRGFFGL
jgi:hypothetical protein